MSQPSAVGAHVYVIFRTKLDQDLLGPSRRNQGRALVSIPAIRTVKSMKFYGVRWSSHRPTSSLGTDLHIEP
jgi:hypothetical protein